jgi:prepilin-type N-terminal cleavage/methylation domain-containing protein
MTLIAGNSPGTPHERVGFLRAAAITVHISQMPSTVTRRAFTLIELLVVVSVIAILIAILIPNLSRARARARTTVCAANLRSLGIASQLYLDEYSRQLPRYYVNTTSADPLGQGRLWWFGFEPNGPGSTANRPLLTQFSPFASYTANLSAAIQCPDFPYNDGSFFPKFDHHAASYGYNLYLAPPVPTVSTSVQRFSARLSTVVLFADAVHFDSPLGFNEAHYLQYMPNVSQPSGYAHFRHGLPRPGASVAQYVYLDAHVDAQSLSGPNYRTVSEFPTGNLVAPDGTDSIYGY